MKSTLTLLTLAVLAAPAVAKPNVILILADDFGYECVTANGGTSYKTPNLDRMAKEGVRFSRCYVQPLCTPTRVQLMTGLYNIRNYTRFGHLDPKQITFAHLFRQAGYKTGIVGKWQLLGGFEGPKLFGFDDYCLWQLTRRPPRYANPGLEINGKEIDYSKGEYGPDLVQKHALDFIQKHKEGPFLLYYPMMLTHNPFQPTPDSKSYDRKAIGEKVNDLPKYFADMTEYMDKQVGQLLEHLDKLGIADNTLVLFVGDNGTGTGITSQFQGRAYKGGKGSSTAAGMHVPCIGYWKGAKGSGRVCEDLVDSTDFLPTMCEAAGIKVESKLDGRSFLPQIQGQKGQPREWIYSWYAPKGGSTASAEFAAGPRYKLYRSGGLYDYLSDTDEKQPIPATTTTPEQRAARQMLQGVLDQFRNARPKQ